VSLLESSFSGTAAGPPPPPLLLLPHNRCGGGGCLTPPTADAVAAAAAAADVGAAPVSLASASERMSHTMGDRQGCSLVGLGRRAGREGGGGGRGSCVLAPAENPLC